MFDLPLYRMEVVYGIDEDGDPASICVFENIIEPEKPVPPFHKLGMVGEAQVAALSDSFDPIPYYDYDSDYDDEEDD